MTYAREAMSTQEVAQHVRYMLDTKQRVMLGIAGPPAGGKSTFADAIHAIFEDQGSSSTVVPMDGFHLDNKLLDELGLRKRKGAPETFDADGFTALLRRLRQSTAPVYLPVFDRERDLSVASARAVPPERG
jgi:pantothenate kinase